MAGKRFSEGMQKLLASGSMQAVEQMRHHLSQAIARARQLDHSPDEMVVSTVRKCTHEDTHKAPVAQSTISDTAATGSMKSGHNAKKKGQPDHAASGAAASVASDARNPVTQGENPARGGAKPSATTMAPNERGSM